MNIDDWLIKFKTNWEDKNIDDVMSLFSVDVVYYETPFKRLNSLDEVREEWAAIENQDKIDLNYNLFSSDGNKYTIQWDLKYYNKEKQKHFSGVYLIKLNEMGLCYEFWHYCEEDFN